MKVWTLTWTFDRETYVEIYASRDDALWGFMADVMEPSTDDLLELEDNGICLWGDDNCKLEEVEVITRPVA